MGKTLKELRKEKSKKKVIGPDVDLSDGGYAFSIGQYHDPDCEDPPINRPLTPPVPEMAKACEIQAEHYKEELPQLPSGLRQRQWLCPSCAAIIVGPDYPTLHTCFSILAPRSKQRVQLLKDIIDKLAAENAKLKFKSRRFGRCPKGHITIYGADEEPRCKVCGGLVDDIAIEVDYGKLQAENAKLDLALNCELNTRGELEDENARLREEIKALKE